MKKKLYIIIPIILILILLVVFIVSKNGQRFIKPHNDEESILADSPIYYSSSRVAYNNTNSGISSNTVQTAIEEIYQGIIGDCYVGYTKGTTTSTQYTCNKNSAAASTGTDFSGSNVKYDNSSGLESINIQNALDELITHVSYCSDNYTKQNETSNSYECRINIQPSTLTVTNNSVSLTYGGSNVENAYSYNGDGTVSCTSSDTTKVTCNVDTTNHKIVVTPVAATTSAVTITVSATATANYYAPTDSTFTVSVARKNTTMSISPTSGSVNVGSSTTTTITTDGDGTKSCTTSSSSVATCSVSGNTVTINGVGGGTATITVKQAQGTNYNAATDKTYSVTVVAYTLVDIMKRSTQLDTGIDFTKPSSYNNEGNGNGVYTLSSTSNNTNPIMYYRGAVNNNNVFFANKCWKIVRSTDTGGVKLIYNGANTGTASVPKCEATGANTQLNGKYSGNNMWSPGHVGYTWGTEGVNAGYTQNTTISGAIYGTSFTYTNGAYKLSAGTNGTVASGYANGRHYTCNETSATATCQNIRYYFYTNKYVSLSGGKNISQALAEIRTTGVKANDTSSNAKQTIDTWYSSNMTSYTSMLEDTVWCNDRSVYDYGAWSESGTTTDALVYNANIRLLLGTPSLSCSDSVDRYTVSSSNGNKMLNYPVGMLTVDEIMLAGYSESSTNGTGYLNTGQVFFTMSPRYIETGMGGVNVALASLQSTYINYEYSYSSNGIRPVVSLKTGTIVSGGTGLTTDPYIIQ